MFRYTDDYALSTNEFPVRNAGLLKKAIDIRNLAVTSIKMTLYPVTNKRFRKLMSSLMSRRRNYRERKKRDSCVQ